MGKKLSKEQTEKIVEHFLIHTFSLLIETLRQLEYYECCRKLEEAKEDILIALEETNNNEPN